MRHSPVLVNHQPNLTAGKTLNNKHPYLLCTVTVLFGHLMKESGKTKPDANYFCWISVLHQITAFPSAREMRTWLGAGKAAGK